MNTAVTIFISIFGGGSLITLIEIFLKRHDRKKENDSEIFKDVRAIKDEVKDVRKEMDIRFDKLDKRIDDGQAIQARARILQFSDKLQSGNKCSKEAFNHTFQDITDYAEHCKKYEDFPNGQAESAIKNIKKIYEELLERERNGESVFF